MIEIQNLNVSIGNVKILRDINLSLNKGSFTGLIGRNGAGKTTIMKVILGIINQKNGNISYNGNNFSKIPTHKRVKFGIGYMPEDRKLIPSLTVLENILLPIWSTNKELDTERIDEVYEMIPEIKKFSQTRALQLSGGQQKLVALARALMIGKELLLLDEPFEGVAPVLAERLIQVLQKIKKTGVTILLSESDLSLSKELLNKIIYIDRGKIN